MKDMIVGNFDADIADVQAGTYVVTIKSYRTEQGSRPSSAQHQTA